MKKNVLWAMALVASGTLATNLSAAERPTLHKTCDPRPDILVHPIYDAYVPYRKQMNRPRYLTGWMASKIAPTSQEALVWQDNLNAGRYSHHDCPPMYRRYFAPKPWEAMMIGARPDTKAVTSARPIPAQPAEPVPGSITSTANR